LANYYAGKAPKPAGKKSAPCLSTSPTGPGHTILKKSMQDAMPGGAGDSEVVEASFSHSPSLPNRHAKFRDVVEIVEFGERDQVSRVHNTVAEVCFGVCFDSAYSKGKKLKIVVYSR